jgi:hypothetical protein
MCVRMITVATWSKHGSWLVKHWDHGFESHLRHGCFFTSFCVVLSCIDRGLTMGQLRPTSKGSKKMFKNVKNLVEEFSKKAKIHSGL